MKHLLCTFSLLFSLGILAQNRFSFEATNKYPLIENGDSLKLAWAGGLNESQFNTIDLNGDGDEDLVVFDRSGNRIIPFLNKLINGSRRYRYAPQYIDSFPVIEHWMLLRDFNCDGKKDIFCYAPGGIGVYENTSAAGNLSFEWALPLHNVRSDYGIGKTNLYVFDIDLPGISDVDGDGDLDIFVFGQGNTMQWHENVVQCGLDFYLNTWCWGRFEEGFLDNSLFLDACAGINKTEASHTEDNIATKGQHSGSTTLIVDLNGDSLQDVILGDVSFSNLVTAFNTGFKDSAFMSSQDTMFPTYDKSAEVFIFPAAFYEDVNFDNKKDLIAAPNIQGSKSLNGIWFYQNTATTGNPTFDFQDSAFLQRDMLDLGEGATPVVVDINIDGLPDLFVSNFGKYLNNGSYESSISYYMNTGTISNPKFTLQTRDFENISQLNLGLNLITTFGDLDNDVDLDMIIGTDDGTLHYFENTGGIANPAFTYVSGNYQNIDVGGYAAPHLFDIDEDGDLDLFIGEEDGTLNYYVNSSPTNASFTLVTQSFGGVNIKSPYSNYPGYSIPTFYRQGDTVSLFVGSHDFGVIQYDSIKAVMAQPPVIVNTIGTGTTASTGFNLTPFGASKRNGRNQMLYRASELKAQGFKYGKITKLSFDIPNPPSNIIAQGFSIKMKNVNMQSISSWETDMEEVFNYIYPFASGWNDISLTTPFFWDGVSDLLIEICFSKNFQAQNIDVVCTDVGFASNAYGDVATWNQVTQDGCAMPYLTASTTRPNIRLNLIPTFIQTDIIVKDGFRNAPAIANLNNDKYPDLILGNHCGGIGYYEGVKFVSTIGVEENYELKTAHLKAYPNPTTGLINIELPEGMKAEKVTAELYDLTGRLIKSSEAREETITLDLTAFADGIYIVLVTDSQSKYYQRIIVQH